MLDLCSSCNAVQDVYLSWTAAIPLAISGISALSGLFSNRAKKTQQEQKQNIDVTEMPQYDDKALYMRNMLMDQFMDRTRFNDDYFSGYTREGLNNLNNASGAANQNIQNILAARGLSGSSAGVSSLVQQQLNRLNQQSSFLNSIPLLADQRAQTNLQNAGAFFRGLPTGSHRTGTTTTTGSTTQPGNMLGGAFSGLANSLFGLYGEGAFDKWSPPVPGGRGTNRGPFGGGYPQQYPGEIIVS